MSGPTGIPADLGAMPAAFMPSERAGVSQADGWPSLGKNDASAAWRLRGLMLS